MSPTSDEERAAAADIWGTRAVPSLAGVHGTIEFIGPIHHAFMKVDDGKVTITPTDGKADTVIRSDVPLVLLRLVRGEINIVTAALRGLAEAEGNLILAIQIAGSIAELGASATTSAAPAQGGQE